MRAVIVLFAPLAFVAAFVTGCASSAPPPAPPPLAIGDGDTGPIAIVREADEKLDEVPRSVRRLVAEQRARLGDCLTLADVVGDRLGRARAQSETNALVERLSSIERALDGWNGDSDRLDVIVDELRRNATRVSLLHETLRTAAQ